MHVGHFDGSLAPVAHVGDGEVFRLRSVSAHPADDVPAEWLQPEVADIFADPSAHGPGPHLLTGPVAVDGLCAGDTLQIDVVDVRPGAPYGYMLVRPGWGVVPDAVLEVQRIIVPVADGAHLPARGGRVTVPLRPFFGILGVAPDPALGRLDSRPPGPHGGNLDCTMLGPGSTLFLPVFVDGAGFSAGDGHAVQGDGEVCLTAVETTMEGVFRLRSRRHLAVSGPIAVTPTHLVVFGVDPSLDRAAELATRAMIGHIESQHGLSFLDAYRLASVAVDLRVTQLVNRNKGVHACLALDLLAQLGPDPFVDAAREQPLPMSSRLEDRVGLSPLVASSPGVAAYVGQLDEHAAVVLAQRW